VTTQKAGADKLKSLDPARHGTVGLSSDALSYDVFSQAGHSQSALRPTRMRTLFSRSAPRRHRSRRPPGTAY